MTMLDILRRQKPAEPAPLASLLAELDLEPFDTTSVEQYKQEKKEATFTALLPMNYGRSNWNQRLVYLPNLPSVTGLVDVDEALFLQHAQEERWDLRFYRDSHFNHIPVAIFLRWRRMSLAEAVATIGVPDYVVNKAVQILDRSPNAVVEVDGLESRTCSYDPFLVVKLGDEEYYIEVWGAEEREFQR